MTKIIIKRSKLNKSAPLKNTHQPIRKLSKLPKQGFTCKASRGAAFI